MRINTGCFLNGCKCFNPDDEDGVGVKSDKEWQGLTQEEVRRIVQSNTDPWCDTPETDGYGVAEMVESKLREKNGNF